MGGAANFGYIGFSRISPSTSDPDSVLSLILCSHSQVLVLWPAGGGAWLGQCQGQFQCHTEGSVCPFCCLQLAGKGTEI